MPRLSMDVENIHIHSYSNYGNFFFFFIIYLDETQSYHLWMKQQIYYQCLLKIDENQHIVTKFFNV